MILICMAITLSDEPAHRLVSLVIRLRKTNVKCSSAKPLCDKELGILRGSEQWAQRKRMGAEYCLKSHKPLQQGCEGD